MDFSSGVRNDFAGQLHKFMACLTDTAYKMEGKTVLYIPEEDVSSSLEKCAKNKELVARLESERIYHFYLIFLVWVQFFTNCHFL